MIEATLDHTLLQKNPHKEHDMALLQKAMHAAALDSPDVSKFLQRLEESTDLPRAEIQDLFWELMDVGTVVLDSALKVKLQ